MSCKQFIDDLLDSTVILILSRVGHSIRRGHRCVSSCTTELECVSGLLDVVVSRKKMRIDKILLLKYSLVPNRRPPPLINFSIFFHPGHSYSNPPAINFLKKIQPRQKFIVAFLDYSFKFKCSNVLKYIPGY